MERNKKNVGGCDQYTQINVTNNQLNVFMGAKMERSTAAGTNWMADQLRAKDEQLERLLKLLERSVKKIEELKRQLAQRAIEE